MEVDVAVPTTCKPECRRGSRGWNVVLPGTLFGTLVPCLVKATGADTCSIENAQRELF
jgi:hypothetical protein